MFVHVGQQPVVDAYGSAVGYELLFRASGQAATAQVEDGDHATALILITTFLDFGLTELVGERLAFVNLPRAFLVGDLPLPFLPGQVVLEVLEDVPADADVIAGVAHLAAQGHLIALDDVTAERDREQLLLPLSHYVKIDLLGTDPADLPELVRRCSGDGRQIIAEKVETTEQLELCRSLGIGLFQGYLTGRPQTLTRRSLAPSQLACLRLVSLLSDPHVRTDEVVSALEADPSLTVRVLQAANSAAAGLARRPGSVREAVLHVGLQTLQAWAVLMGLGVPADGVPLSAALVRARMCQLLAGPGVPDSSAFLAGLLSGLAEALGVEPADLLEQLPVAQPVSAALLDRSGPLGAVLAAVLVYETGGQLPEPPPEQARSAYLTAQVWTSRTASLVA